MLSEYLLYALKYLRLVCAARKLIIPLVAIICVAGWLAVWFMPNVYQSETRVYVDQRTMLDALLDGIVIDDRDIERDLVDVARVSLLTQRNLEQVATENNMLTDAETRVERELVLKNLSEKIWLSSQRRAGGQGTQDLVIAYRSKNPEHSKSVVNSFLNLFVNSVLRGSREDSDNTLEFLDERISEYKEKLEDSEDKLKSFRSANIGVMPGEGNSFFDELRSVTDRVNEARLSLRESTQRRDQLNRQYERLTSGNTSGANSSARKAEQIQALEERLDSLLLQFTSNHPDVVATREQLRLLKRNFVPPTLDTDSFGSQVALAEFQLEIGKAEGDVASAQARFQEYTERKQQLDEAISTIPEIEAQLQKLTRDYDGDKERYDELVRSRQKALISTEKDVSDSQGKFTVVEPPRTLPLPVEPNRPLLLTLIFLGAWAVGIAIPIFLDFVRPAVSTLQDINRMTDFPVLGTVSMAETSAAGMRVGTKTVGLFLLATTIVYIVLAVISLQSKGL